MKVFCPRCNELLPALNGMQSTVQNYPDCEVHTTTCGHCKRIWRFTIKDLGSHVGKEVTNIKLDGKLKL